MNENIELYKHISKDCDMAIFTLQKLLEDIKEKDNKIKITVEEIIHKYEKYYQEACKYLKKNHETTEKTSVFGKMGAKMGIKKEVQADNSDASLAKMIIEGVVMGTLDMEKKIKDYEEIAEQEQLKFAKDFLTFQQSVIENLKKYL